MKFVLYFRIVQNKYIQDLLQRIFLHDDDSANALPSHSRYSHCMLWCNNHDLFIFGNKAA